MSSPPKREAEDEERTAALLLAWNAINFSYYPDQGRARWRYQAPDGSEHGADDEANGVVAALVACNSARPAGATPPLADAAFLTTIDAEMLRERIFTAAPGAGELPLCEERAAALREVGMGLQRLGLTPLGVVKAAKGSAAALVATLVREFPSYADVQSCGGSGGGSPSSSSSSSDPPVLLEFHKRAQLCASMLHAARACGVEPSEEEGPGGGGELGNGGSGSGGGFSDMAALTVFADYRLPQLLRADDVRVLALSPALAAQIESGTPIARGALEEVCLRAATVHAAALIGDALRAREEDGAAAVTQAQLDYYLWKLAVRRDAAGELPAFHRTRCTAY